MIKTFRNKITAAVFAGRVPKGIARDIAQRAKLRLDQLHRAARLDDLKLPPSNRLEKLKGERAGQWSIRINDQWRLCFRFDGEDAFDVEITDHH